MFTLRLAVLLVGAGWFQGGEQLGATAPPLAATVAQLRYEPPPFDGRVGRIIFHNTALYPLRVTLWHPDSRSPWREYTLQGGERSFLNGANGEAVFIGNDWGIQLGTEIRPAGQVADWNGTWNVTVETFWNR